ncbi:SIS domain-containing protein [Mergibacter septicus]|uniref:D-sedoheptulose-7-phosphate isomerase n=1 Tax=Mergibacter septicus TaxID=221402 RepID=UPI001178D982|nr:SIS domain-containing protein [Mergibacter septicus]AWX13289.1 SIS domain-containing protein [Mergibacter septicus]
MLNKIKSLYQQSIQQQQSDAEQLPVAIQQGVNALTSCLINGNKIIVCGLGRSNSNAQLLVTNLLHRYHCHRPSFPAILLSFDGTVGTTILADNSSEEFFKKQFNACANKGDLLVVLVSKSNTQDVLPLLRIAKNKFIPILAISTTNATQISELLTADDVEISVSAQLEPRVLEQHLFIINTLSELLEQELFPHLRS